MSTGYRRARGEMAQDVKHSAMRARVIAVCVVLFLVHVFCMLYQYGGRPPAPVIGDEVTINDPAIAVSRGLGLVAPSFKDSIFGFDKLYAHFPPVYVYIQSLAFRAFGVSVYSLRLTATVTDICAAAVFLWFLYWLWRRGLVDSESAAIVAGLYTLNASVIALHRIARMEPLIELLAISALWCVTAAAFSASAPAAPGSGAVDGPRRSLVLFALGCALSGVCMVTHPEALTAVLPILLMVWLEPGLRTTSKLLALANFIVVPVAIWLAAYRSRTMDALHQMWRIGRFTPGPGVFSFAHSFTREDHRNVGQGMRASLFALCLAILVCVLLSWWRLERESSRGDAHGGMDQVQLRVARSFAIGTAVSLVLLIWLVGASISRYEVIYPVWLLGLALLLRGISRTGLVRAAAGFALGVVAAEIVATGVYLWRPEASPVDADAHRFDAIVKQIPPGETVAATPMLWLAFEQNNRPFTLLYWRYDGRQKWAQENGGNPLRQFDAVVIDHSFIDDYKDDTPFAAVGRVDHRYGVGSNVVDLFLPR